MTRQSIDVSSCERKITMWKAILESSFIGKILFVGFVCLLFWFMQARYERVQKELAQKEEQCLFLQTANKKQQENIARLVLEQQKQEELLLQAEQEKQALVQKYQTKQKQVYKTNDNASKNWKNTPIPNPILQILQQN